MKSKKIQASSAEKSAIALGSSQVKVGNQLKAGLDPLLSRISKQDNTNILRAKNNAATGAAVVQQLAKPGDVTTRTAAIAGGANALTRSNTVATDNNARDRLSKMKTTADLLMGSTGAANSAIVSTAAAQNNAAATIARAEMEKQNRVINAVGSIPLAIQQQNLTKTAFNNDAMRTAQVTNSESYDQMNMWGRLTKVKNPNYVAAGGG